MSDEISWRQRAEQAERERDRLRKIFDDTGGDEHNVLALIDHYQDSAIAATARAETAEGLLQQSTEVLATIAYWHEKGHVDESWFAEAKTVADAARSHLQSLKGGSDVEG